MKVGGGLGPRDDRPYPRIDLLTADERMAIDMAGRLWDQLCTIVGRGPTRDADLAELVIPIHQIQRYVMSHAAARAMPEHYRLLGERLPR